MPSTLDVVFIGIDPGEHGGIAVLDEDGAIVFVSPFSSDAKHLWEIFQEVKDTINGCDAVVCLLERVHSMPRQSSQSGFTFGKNVGILVGMLTACDIAYTEVTPQKWMKGLDIKPGGSKENKSLWKKKLLNLAIKTWPTERMWRILNMKQKLSICDALLIANYARLSDGGNNGSN